MDCDFSLNGTWLKVIAFVSMVIDHFGVIVYPKLECFDVSVYQTFRFFGRMAFPIYCFLLVEGYMHTKSIIKYICRLLVFGLISEPIFDYVIFGDWFYKDYQNVYFTLYIGLLALVVLDFVNAKMSGIAKYGLGFFSVVFLSNLSVSSSFDYGFKGVLFIVAFYLMKKSNRVVKAIFYILMCLLNIGMVLVLPLLCLYNGRPGKRQKYLFYALYPGHLIVLYSVKLLAAGG